MNIRSEKGISGIDIIVAIFLITMFVTLITVMSGRLTTTEKETGRSAEAVRYATNIIEEIKGESILSFDGVTNADIDNLVALEVSAGHLLEDYTKQYILDSNNQETAFYQEVFVIDYADIENGAEREKLKKIIVKVSYKEQEQNKSVTLETMINGGT